MSAILSKTLTLITAVDRPVWQGKISRTPTLEGELQSCSGMSLLHLSFKRTLLDI